MKKKIALGLIGIATVVSLYSCQTKSKSDAEKLNNELNKMYDKAN